MKRTNAIPSAIAAGFSLIALLAAGWVKIDIVKVALSVLSAALFVAAFIKAANSLSPRFINATPKQLAWIRILVCLTAVIMTAVENLTLIAQLPPDFRRHEGCFGLLNMLPGYAALLSNSVLLGILQWSTVLVLLLALVGFKTRFTLLLSAVSFFVTQAILRQHSYFFHTGIVPLSLLFVLPWTPCGAAWSVDHRLNRASALPSRRSIAFSIYACLAIISLVYLFSGLSKLRESGLSWFAAENIQHKLLQESMEPIFLGRWNSAVWLVQHHTPEIVYSILGGAGVAIELSYFTVLFSRAARIVVPLAAFVVHIGILLLQHILFFDLLVLQLVFLNADRLAIFAARILHRASPKASTDDKDARDLPFVPRFAMALTIAGLCMVWIFRVESYPVSSWLMYSDRQSNTPVFYYRMVANLENGRPVGVPPRDYSPAFMCNSRFILKKAFQPGQTRSLEQFLRAYIEQRNRQMKFGSRILSIEIQRWAWDYAHDPADSSLGRVSHRYVFNAAPEVVAHLPQ